MSFKASAPGSLMLLGEYGVLYGKPALVCAIDKRITVTLTPRKDNQIEIKSALGNYSTLWPQLKIEKPFHFVLGALKQFQPKLRQGCDIDIVSEFSDTVGLGSSAAVTVATLATLVTWLNIRISPLDFIRQGRQVIRQIQGVGSGADIAAAVHGGIVAYHPQPLAAEKFSQLHPLAVLYSGFKTTTIAAIKQVQQTFALHPAILRHLTNSIGQCTLDAMPFVRREDWSRVGEIMNIQNGMLESLGVSLPLLHDMVAELRKQKDMLGAKISGAGLGDCVIGLGLLPQDYAYIGKHADVQTIPVNMTLQGVYCEKN